MMPFSSNVLFLWLGPDEAALANTNLLSFSSCVGGGKDGTFGILRVKDIGLYGTNSRLVESVGFGEGLGCLGMSASASWLRSFESDSDSELDSDWWPLPVVASPRGLVAIIALEFSETRSDAPDLTTLEALEAAAGLDVDISMAVDLISLRRSCNLIMPESCF
jgi:hypothetical protein